MSISGNSRNRGKNPLNQNFQGNSKKEATEVVSENKGVTTIEDIVCQEVFSSEDIAKRKYILYWCYISKKV